MLDELRHLRRPHRRELCGGSLPSSLARASLRVPTIIARFNAGGFWCGALPATAPMGHGEPPSSPSTTRGDALSDLRLGQRLVWRVSSSEWLWMSMNPGASTLPLASRTASPGCGSNRSDSGDSIAGDAHIGSAQRSASAVRDARVDDYQAGRRGPCFLLSAAGRKYRQDVRRCVAQNGVEMNQSGVLRSSIRAGAGITNIGWTVEKTRYPGRRCADASRDRQRALSACFCLA